MSSCFHTDSRQFIHQVSKNNPGWEYAVVASFPSEKTIMIYMEMEKCNLAVFKNERDAVDFACEILKDRTVVGEMANVGIFSREKIYDAVEKGLRLIEESCS